MKLRNKKTGEIVVFGEGIVDLRKIGCKNVYEMIRAGWEDYEELKEHYIITEYGGVISLNEYEGLNNIANPEDYRAIGNYFETQEQAEKAVEKLKAWKRLKDKGFRFVGVAGISDMIKFRVDELFSHCAFDPYVDSEVQKEYYNDLMLVFGGEE